ncbi:MAG: Alkyl hydroperoxide reductase subunit C-like protein, partial [uncultured Solirubrobacteraceae bacterium]
EHPSGGLRRSAVHLASRGRRAVHARRPRGQDDRARLLSRRVQLGLHRPVSDLRRGPRRPLRAGRDALRRLDRPDRQPGRVSRVGRHDDPDAVRRDPAGGRGEGVRRLLRADGRRQPRARHRRPRPEGAVVVGGRAPGHPAGGEPHLRRPRRRQL